MSENPAIPPHGGQLFALAAHLGLAASEILDFSANINPDGPPPGVLQALRQALDDPATLTSYPDLESTTLRDAIACHLEVPPHSIAVANGFVPLLEAAIRSRRIARCLLPVPAFSEYRRTLERCAAEVIPYPLAPHAWQLEPEHLLAAIRAAKADAILLANPQNPSGTLWPRNRLVDLIAAFQHLHFLVDEAFVDYVPEASLSVLAAARDNLTVFRSVTKFFAMPGLRVAYCVSARDRISTLNRQLPPWPISTLAEVAVAAALAGHAYQENARATNRRRRATLAGAFTQLGIAVEPAAANFLLLRLPSDAHTIREKLLHDHRILVRSCANFEALPGEYIRVAVRGEAQNARLVQAFKDVLFSEART